MFETRSHGLEIILAFSPTRTPWALCSACCMQQLQQCPRNDVLCMTPTLCRQRKTDMRGLLRCIRPRNNEGAFLCLHRAIACLRDQHTRQLQGTKYLPRSWRPTPQGKVVCLVPGSRHPLGLLAIHKYHEYEMHLCNGSAIPHSPCSLFQLSAECYPRENPG
jgi:hypothetical protein